ncbi:hypothetical protein CK203_108371 [Vitis vinifera]|uniref:Uncharacterized protein n=1 Tax=Vitis vinifera TaxID=29760 RepID=A0A438CU64_VITVI|nr:hypothetical protein CK203_108371 [Vitis vinifera]
MISLPPLGPLFRYKSPHTVWEPEPTEMGSSSRKTQVEDLNVEGINKCYFLDFLGPKGFAVDLSQKSPCQVIGFDHRKSSVSKIPSPEDCPENLKFHFDLERSSSNAVYEYFSNELADMKSPNGEAEGLLNPEDRDRIEMVLKYIEDGDLCRWKLPDIKAFNIGLSGWRSKFNSITNPCMYEQVG